MKFDLDFVVKLLVIIGALNWLLVAFGFNLVEAIFGFMPVLVQAVYVIVGLCGLYMLYLLFQK
ncbi:MAG: DUF378 domain-containing protein [Candidatus Aenigmatarchaeota archaeon]